MAAGGFVTRAFDSMIKECANKKYTALQSAIQNYLESGKDFKEQSNIGVTNQALSTVSNQSSSDVNPGALKIETHHSVGTPSADVEVDSTSGPASTYEHITTALANAGHTLGGPEAELVLNPLRLAFETKNIKIVELALDCLHKLIAYDHLEGDPGLEDGNNAQLFTNILNIVCKCVDNSSPDSTILQVLKVLLTVVASTKMRVHGEVMMGIIQVCNNIAVNSKSPVNQATSKAMLTQMLSIIVRRMETDAVSSSDQNEPAIALGDVLSVKETNGRSLFSAQEMQNLAGGNDIKGLEALLKKTLDLEDGEVTRGIGLESKSIGQYDAVLLFHTLCKMVMKDQNDEATMKTRIVSLELLQGLFEGVGHSFIKNCQFIDSIKAHLSYALLKASLSQSPLVFQYATGIFSVILLQFRENLKAEIGVFFPFIVLRPLDGSDLNQKLSVLRMLEKICKDSQMLVDLYVNYDCDHEAPNIFERIVTSLSKIAQGTQNVDPKSATASQTGLIKTSSLQGLVNVLKSLVEWEKSRREAERQNETSSRESDTSLSREDSPKNFEELQAHISTIDDVISQFNRNPVRGIDHLISCKLVENNPASVAQFLQNTPDLNKAMVGDYLGQHEEFPLTVMHAYVDAQNFSGMKFDIATREFFKGFRLPGDAQKIDRIIEKFAERYFAENPGLFKNPDTAYVLAYAVITLNRDAHNPMVQPKMSKVDFVHINTINGAEESAPQELLEEIYDSIVKEEIEMNDSTNILNLALPKRSSQNEAIIKQIQAIIKDHGGKGRVFYTSNRIELVHPMVESVGWPLLATFALTMGEMDNNPRIGLCMEGFKEGVHITHVLGMDTMRYAFLTSLIRYNSLHAPRDMRVKNVEALATLLSLCDSKINALQDSWHAILECISRLEYTVSSPAMAATVMQGSNHISRDAILHSLRELAGKPSEQVFINSVKLPGESVVEFFTALCSVSAEELKQNPPRVFSLQKIVEISYYNMARVRMVWARIWSVLAHHFVLAGSHHDEKVAKYAIDSLRQLGLKYLERAELANFTFQNDILKPFILLMRSARSESIRRLIVEDIVQMIKSKGGSIKSGWRSMFIIFTAAADDDVEAIVESAFENVEQVILEHFDQVVGNCFMDCLNCLIGFANNKSSPPISLKAIALLRICEDRLAEGLITGVALKPIDLKIAQSGDVFEHYWFPMLAGLSDLTSDPRPEVRNCALEVLFDSLNERGGKFASSFWEKIFQRVLFPIFDHVRRAEEESFVSSGEEWLRENSVHSLQLLCNLFNTFYKDVCFMLPTLLGLLLDCSKKSDQSVVSISLGALVHLIEVGGHQFSEQDWDTLLKSIRDASYTTQPLELLSDLGFENLKSSKVWAKDTNTSLIDNTSPVDSGSNLSNNGHHIIMHENGNLMDHIQEERYEGTPSPSGRVTRPTDGGIQRSQTIRQKFMGNVMGNMFMRSFTSKSKDHESDVMVPSSPSKFPDSTLVPDSVDEDESQMFVTVRSKCITQLLLLGAIDSIQKKYWNKLNKQQKIIVMEISLSVLEFAASYNSYTNLRLRMRQIPAERPPLNLLRQELAGTRIYLDILQKTTDVDAIQKTEEVKEEKLIAEEKLVSFCEQVLKDASELQSSMEETTNTDVHRVLELRSPIIVKVLNGMCNMNTQIFKNHLRVFYPLITELICCDQMAIRGALADLLSKQLKTLLP